MAIHNTSSRSALAHVLTRRSLIVTTTGLVLAPTVVSAQGTPEVASPAATPAFASLDDLLAAAVDHGVPGIALAVERGGEPVFSGAAGVASLEEQTPLQPTDRFRIYSVTKTFTATVVLQLVDEGILSLDDTVAGLLDDPEVGRIPNVDNVTVRQLLNHTSGIYDYQDETDSPFYEDAFLGANADWTKVWTTEELLHYADGTRHDPYFAPGESFHYSNTGYLLLGMVVEQATGNAFADELGARILTPLSLKDTSLEMGKALPDDVVDGYQTIENELVNVSAINLSWSWTGGAMVSTMEDLVRFAQAVFGGELLSPESFKEMFAYIPDPQVQGLGWGMGLYRVQTPNGELAGMDGGGAGGTSYMMHLADADVTVAVLANWAPDDGSVNAILHEAVAWTLAQPVA